MSEEIDLSKLVGIKQAAEIAGVDRSSILRAIKNGHLEAKLVPALFNREWWGITMPALQKWIVERKRGNMDQTTYRKYLQIGDVSVLVALKVSSDEHKVTSAYTDSFTFKAHDAFAMFGGKTEEEIKNDGFVIWQSAMFA